MTPRCPTCGQVNHRISSATPEQPETWGDFWRAFLTLLLVIASFTALVIAFEGVAR